MMRIVVEEPDDDSASILSLNGDVKVDFVGKFLSHKPYVC